MSFEVGADSYDRFMGRYSRHLAPQLADLAGVAAGMRVLDVGCGPGALTSELLARGAVVSAVDPSEPFVAAARERFPDADVRHAPAEALPFTGATFGAACAQLVVQFMTDPVAGIGEMRRVTEPGGAVVACVWDFGTGRSPLTPFWRAALALDPATADESERAGTQDGQLVDVFRAAGLRDVEQHELVARVEHPSFEEWWDPFTLGVGPAGEVAQQLGPDGLAALRERARSDLGDGPFAIDAVAWAARGVV
jgi:ubiquinone/menaquinone biosynthesis C-methylase UbiE